MRVIQKSIHHIEDQVDIYRKSDFEFIDHKVNTMKATLQNMMKYEVIADSQKKDQEKLPNKLTVNDTDIMMQVYDDYMEELHCYINKSQNHKARLERTISENEKIIINDKWVKQHLKETIAGMKSKDVYYQTIVHYYLENYHLLQIERQQSIAEQLSVWKEFISARNDLEQNIQDSARRILSIKEEINERKTHSNWRWIRVFWINFDKEDSQQQIKLDKSVKKLEGKLNNYQKQLIRLNERLEKQMETTQKNELAYKQKLHELNNHIQQLLAAENKERMKLPNQQIPKKGTLQPSSPLKSHHQKTNRNSQQGTSLHLKKQQKTKKHSHSQSLINPVTQKKTLPKKQLPNQSANNKKIEKQIIQPSSFLLSAIKEERRKRYKS